MIAVTLREPRVAELTPPVGQAARWYADVTRYVGALSGHRVAFQLARLCGDNSLVTLPWRSLADAVGLANRGGHTRSYVKRGTDALVESGWLRIDATGRGRSAKTTFLLMPGPLSPSAV